ncbi:MAG TPA: hypothetical protein VEI83_01460 [Acidimicrobiales bacterium]|nr:hypothetical protein [Acidimicrobiales bacterium]
MTAVCLVVGTSLAVVLAVPSPSSSPSTTGAHVTGALRALQPPTTTTTTTTTTAPPPPPPTTAPPGPRPVVAPTPAPAPPPPPPPVVHAVVVTALGDPSASIPPDPDFRTVCASGGFDQSSSCVGTTLAAIDHARALSGLPDMTLPSNWWSLDGGQQLFVATDLERTVRGLPPLSAMASALDGAAVQGVQSDSDPGPPPGFPWTAWGSNWAGNLGNPLEAMYLWMYDDGSGGGNVNCSPSDPGGCWEHRHNILMGLACAPCVMGAAWGTGPSGITAGAEILTDSSGSPAVDFTWAEEQPYLG